MMMSSSWILGLCFLLQVPAPERGKRAVSLNPSGIDHCA